ncbi:hypothetical protein HDU92_003637 [Lobulomyces angularis]|nr:hypothetical protein HDU92_003637 [Lobulomyces angularis]
MFGSKKKLNAENKVSTTINKTEVDKKPTLQTLPKPILIRIIGYSSPNLQELRLASKTLQEVVQQYISNASKWFKNSVDDAVCWGSKAPQLSELLFFDPTIIKSILEICYREKFLTTQENLLKKNKSQKEKKNAILTTKKVLFKCFKTILQEDFENLYPSLYPILYEIRHLNLQYQDLSLLTFEKENKTSIKINILKDCGLETSEAFSEEDLSNISEFDEKFNTLNIQQQQQKKNFKKTLSLQEKNENDVSVISSKNSLYFEDLNHTEFDEPNFKPKDSEWLKMNDLVYNDSNGPINTMNNLTPFDITKLKQNEQDSDLINLARDIIEKSDEIIKTNEINWQKSRTANRYLIIKSTTVVNEILDLALEEY